MESEREPFFRAPWPLMALIAVLIAAFGMQSYLGVGQIAMRLGFAPANLMNGRLATLVLALFVHGSWAHVLINSAFILAFGAPVSRRMGQDGRGAAAFLIFFLLCGVLANAGYALVHPGDLNVVVGASGAGAALMAATSRLMGPGPGLAPLLSRPVLAMGGAFVVLNLIYGAVQAFGVVGLAPGAAGALVAWDVHLFGYAAGLLLFAPWLRLIRRG